MSTNNDKELTYGEQVNVAHGLGKEGVKGGEKVPFPAMVEIEWVMVEASRWYRNVDQSYYTFLSFKDGEQIKIENTSSYKRKYSMLKTIYENSKDFTVTWELKYKHADIKAKYAAAKEAEKNGGLIVKVFCKTSPQFEYLEAKTNIRWIPEYEYKLRYYRINWNKFLAWHYARGIYGEVIVSTVKQHIDKGFGTKKRLIGYCENSEAPFKFNHSGPFPYCRLAPGVEIQDEWLEEVTDEA